MRHTSSCMRRSIVIAAFIVYLIILFFLVYLAYGVAWTGFGEARVDENVRPAKTLWDWLQFLAPVIIAAQIAFLTNRVQKYTSETQRELEESRAQDGAEQAYIDQTINLLINVDMRNTEEADKVRTLLGARTRMTLNRLDSYHTGSVVLFLYDAQLIQGEHPTVSLDGTNLSGVFLGGVDLREANLCGTDLSRAYLSGTNLSGADLSGADLTDAYVSEKQLLSAWSLEGATMPNGQKYEEWIKDKEGRGEDGENSGPK
jgi:pentapeptide repeat protein